MARRKSKKHKKRRRASKVSPSSGPVFFKHPFEQIPKEKLRRHFIQVGQTSKERFSALVADIRQLMAGVDPILTLSYLSVHGLMVGVSSGGVRNLKRQDMEFMQSHVELAQAMFLQIPAAEVSRTYPPPHAIPQLIDMLSEVSRVFSLRRMALMEEERSDEAKATIALQEQLRLHTQMVRNWGYFDKVVRIVSDLCAPLDTAFADQLGISATDLIKAFRFMVRMTESRITSRWAKLRPVFQERTLRGIIAKYYEQFPHLRDNPQEFLRYATDRGIGFNEMKAMILAHANIDLDRDLSFTAKEVAEHLGRPVECVERALVHLSHGFGDLADSATEHLFLTNPVWRKPLVTIGDDEFLSPVPTSFFSFIFPILADLTGANVTLKHAWHDRRAMFLEDEVESLFRVNFPNAELVRGYQWTDGTERYENDLLVLIDSHLLLVEAKSGAISWPALRGAPDRARKHIEELLIEPSMQSARLAEHLRKMIDRGATQEDLPGLDLSRVCSITRLSITLEDLAMIQANLHEIEGTGWIPENHILAPCMLLSDIEIVFDMLPSVGQRLHYLVRRSETQSNIHYYGDELDVLGMYLGTGLNLPGLDKGDCIIQCVNMSQDIDKYCMARVEGVSGKKPEPRLTTWWRDICLAVEKRNFHRWTEVVLILLSIAFDDQQKGEGMFRKVRKGILKNWRDPDHVCSVVIEPPSGRRDAVVFYGYREDDKEQRHNRMELLASKVFTDAGISRCVIVGVNVDIDTGPYSTLAVYDNRSS